MVTFIIRSILCSNDLEHVAGGYDDAGDGWGPGEAAPDYFMSDSSSYQSGYESGYDDGYAYDFADGAGYDATSDAIHDGVSHDGTHPTDIEWLTERHDQPSDHTQDLLEHPSSALHATPAHVGDATTFYEGGPRYTIDGAQKNYDSALAALKDAEAQVGVLSANADGWGNQIHRYFVGKTTVDSQLEYAQGMLRDAQSTVAAREGDLARAVSHREAATGERVGYHGVPAAHEAAFDTSPIVEARKELQVGASVQLSSPIGNASLGLSTDRGFELKLGPDGTLRLGQVGPVKMDVQRVSATDAHDGGYALGVSAGPFGVKASTTGDVTGSLKGPELGLGLLGFGVSAKGRVGYDSK